MLTVSPETVPPTLKIIFVTLFGEVLGEANATEEGAGGGLGDGETLGDGDGLGDGDTLGDGDALGDGDGVEVGAPNKSYSTTTVAE